MVNGRGAVLTHMVRLSIVGFGSVGVREMVFGGGVGGPCAAVSTWAWASVVTC